MSMNSRYRERKYNTSDNDRLLRALSQPVQAWDKKWTPHSNSKTLQTFKWIKSERVIEYEQDEESEEEPEPMETEQSTEVEQVEPKIETEQPVTKVEQETESNQESEKKIEAVGDAPNSKKSEQSIPGGPSSLITNKAISSVRQDDMDEDDSRSQTPKLNDISDEEVDQRNDNDDDDDTVDNMDDPSKHPALAPHAQVHMTDDEAMTDSTAATPQTESNTPMPQLEDDHMEESPQIAHPLSQEILTSIIASEEIASLNNDSPAIQTPEDVVPNHIQHED
ncbi:hypothetical protein BDF21DRAFT_491522 [Thamnidium elegans]|nr:hypothetical protein BDF21DRAFT_491522 [Thamnidium elegans]